MRQTLTLAMLLVVTAGSMARAQRPEMVAQALRDRYPSEQTQIVGQPREINGVKLYEVEVRGNLGTSRAYLTEFGDFLSSGTPASFNRLPQGVRELREVFRTIPENIDTYVVDGYAFDISRGNNRVYRLRFNALGELREITNPDDVARADPARLPKAGNEIARKFPELAKSRIAPGARLRDVYKDPANADFYIGNFTAAGGKTQLIDMDEMGATLWSRTEIDIREVPPSIRNAFEKMFESSKVLGVYRMRTEYAQFEQRTEQGDVVIMRIRPDGTVMDIRNVDLTEEDRVISGSRPPAAPGRRDLPANPQYRPPVNGR